MTTDLITLDRAGALALFSDRASIDAALEDLRQRGLQWRGDPDPSTEEGRERIASAAYKIAQSGVAMVDAADALTAEWRERTKFVNAERDRIKERYKEIKAEIRKPLTDAENFHKARKAAHEAALAAIENTAKSVGPTGFEISARLSLLDELLADKRDWQEFTYRAEHAIRFARLSLDKMLADAQAEKAAAVERQRRAAEEEAARQAELARQQAEREAEIARQAAENARIAAERAAATEAGRIADHEAGIAEILATLNFDIEPPTPAQFKERMDYLRDLHDGRDWQEFAGRAQGERANAFRLLLRRKMAAEAASAAEAERQRIEEQAAAAIARAEKAERQRAEVEWQLKIDADAAEKRRLRAAADADDARKEAAKKAERDRIDALDAERARVAAAAKAAADADAKRIADKKHRALINNSIKEDLIAAGFDADTAHAVVVALAKGIVRHVKVQY